MAIYLNSFEEARSPEGAVVVSRKEEIKFLRCYCGEVVKSKGEGD